MICKRPLMKFLGKTTLLTVAGFLAVTFAGPLLALLVSVLACALVGFLLWLPLHTFVFGRDAALRPTLDRGRDLLTAACDALHAGGREMTNVGRRVRRFFRGSASALGPVLLEVLSGALLGVLLLVALTAGAAEHAAPPALARAAALGALAGVLVLVLRRRSAAPLADSSHPGS